MQKKIYIFSVAVFFLYLFCAKTQLGKITTQGGMPLSGSHVHWEKTVSSDVSGNYLIKDYHQES
jgi:iron complex outermembrane receptor protein